MASATIGVLGDVMLGRAVAEALDRVPPQDVWADEVREIAAGCDAVVCNLECCVSARGTPTERIAGKPFFFRAPPAAIDSLRAIGVAAVGLANNHALDYETEALLDTLEAVRGAGIALTGAGLDESDARRGVAIDAGDARIGLVAVSDHPAEFAAASEAPGIAHADLRRGAPNWLVDEIGRLRAACDAVIAFPHWGPNMTTAPAGWQRAVAERMHEAGADAVAGHSAHVFHGVGWSSRGPAMFDLGDALDDYAVDAALRNDLGVMAVWRPGGGDAELELVGLALDFCHSRLAEGADAEWIAARLKRACAELGTGVERAGEQRFVVRPA
ncbi:MAG TPA: CapA family protein [Solirubrobacterales bacterium]|nr:CapA family protein [Solirubrobacterales bacterium]